jgi:hypothetical protein
MDAHRNAFGRASAVRQGKYQQVRDYLRLKEVRLHSAPGRRRVTYHRNEGNPTERAH